jgi:hypothetical protein
MLFVTESRPRPAKPQFQNQACGGKVAAGPFMLSGGGGPQGFGLAVKNRHIISLAFTSDVGWSASARPALPPGQACPLFATL